MNMSKEKNKDAEPVQGTEVKQENNSSLSGVNDGFVRITCADEAKEIKQGVLYKIPGEKFEELFAVIFLLIASNRKEKKQIDAKKLSCQSVGMTTPALAVGAQIVSDAGYELVNPITGEKAQDKDLKDKLAIMEGNTRSHACLAAAREGNPFDYTFLRMSYSTPDLFKTAYRQTNLCNERTKVKDYTNDVLATETSNPILKSYRDKCDQGISPKGAAYATLLKEITKRDITSIFNGKTPDALNDKDILKYSDRIYKAVVETFSPNKLTPLVKGTIFWRWTASKLAVAKNEEDREDVTTKIENVFKQMTASICNLIRDAKGNGSNTREQIIHKLLDTEYSKY